MKINKLVVIVLLLTLISCAAHQKSLSDSAASTSSSPDGLSIKNAIPVNNIAAEYQWVRAHYPGGQVQMQALLQQKRKAYDMLQVKVDDKVISVYFDISSFFGKGF